jgi:TusA-related sulfurtransferase
MQDAGKKINNEQDIMYRASRTLYQEVFMGEEFTVDKTIDIRGQICPYTFVRSKLAVEKMNVGEVLEIILDHKPAVENVPRSMENEGQKVLKIDQTGEKEWHIFVRKDKEKKKQ